MTFTSHSLEVPADYVATAWTQIDYGDRTGEGSYDHYRLDLECHDGRWSLASHEVVDVDGVFAGTIGVDISDLEDVNQDSGLLLKVRDQAGGPDPLAILQGPTRGQLT